MTENWTRIFYAKDLYQVKIAEDVLKQNGIESHIVNKQDSAIPAIGLVELYAPNVKAEKAVEILEKHDIKGVEE